MMKNTQKTRNSKKLSDNFHRISRNSQEIESRLQTAKASHPEQAKILKTLATKTSKNSPEDNRKSARNSSDSLLTSQLEKSLRSTKTLNNFSSPNLATPKSLSKTKGKLRAIYGKFYLSNSQLFYL
jgi:hypothetical protein